MQAHDLKAILVDRGDPHGADDTIKPDAVLQDLAGLMCHIFARMAT